MAVTVGDIVRIIPKMKWFGTDDVVNVFTYRVDVNTAVDDAAFMVQVASRLDIAYSFMTGQQSTSFTYDSVDGINITKNELLPNTPWPVLTSGSSATAINPQQLALCAFWPTITPKVRTSAFFGGFVTFTIDSLGEVTAVARGFALSAALEIRNLITGTIDVQKGSLNPLTSVFTEAGVPQVPVRWRTQRRRRIGVGS